MVRNISKKISHPIHPGEVFREEIINQYELSATYTAALLHLSKENLSHIINGKQSLTPSMCLRISTVFGGDAEKWATLQMKYDLEKNVSQVKALKLKPYKPL